jgi:hypothetical protein
MKTPQPARSSSVLVNESRVAAARSSPETSPVPSWPPRRALDQFDRSTTTSAG